MSDFEVGYGKPPKHSRFKKGVSANPKGRPRQKSLSVGDIIDKVLNTPAEYRERGQIKSAARRELTLKTHMRLALKGDVKSAEMLLELRAHALRFGDSGVHRVQIGDWLPDYAGQTAEQKTRDFSMQDDVAAPQWWKRTDINPTREHP